MLEKASLEKIEQLRLMPGKEVVVLALATCEVGALIRVQTASDNTYLFEVTDPAAHRAHVVRCDARFGDPSSAGYRGERFVSPVFRIGEQIFHGPTINRLSNTSARGQHYRFVKRGGAVMRR